VLFRSFTEKLTEYTPDEMIGQNLITFVSTEDYERARHNLMHLGGGQTNREYRIIIKDGSSLDLDIGSDALRNEDGKPFGRVFVCRDITPRKLAEQERTKLHEQLVQSQKMESVGRLAGGVAHDFNNMLTVIIGNSEMALQDIKTSDKLFAVLKEILNAGERSADLTRQLLAFARKQTINPKPLDLNDIVTKMLKMLQRLIGEDINLVWMPGQHLWSVNADPSQVDQIMVNLVVNSRDAIEDTGKITIETANAVYDEAYCKGRADCLPGEYVVLAVSDNGMGMSKDILKNIFEPFFTTKKSGQGTGLGLSTVYGIVRQNNGFVNVYSEPGQGTTFRIYLPRFVDENAMDEKDKDSYRIRRGTETVLVVEDEAAVLNLSREMIEKLGYNVLAARTADEALSLVSDYEGKIDLILTDVVMPEMNGKDLARRIVSIRPDIKCLYMSGYTSNVIAHHGILDKDVRFIAKPFSLRDLANHLRDTIDEK
jgi:PAS domain S-box-containing protein